jgi:hypothetical protein
MKNLPLEQMLFRWQRACILCNVLLQYHDKRHEHFIKFSRLANDTDVYNAEIYTFSAGDTQCVARRFGPAVWVGFCNDDPRRSIEYGRELELHARAVLKRRFHKDKWILPARVDGTVGWTFAMSREQNAKGWVDATGKDARCTRCKYLDYIVKLGEDAEIVAPWIANSFGVATKLNSVVLKVLQGQLLTDRNVKELAVACTPKKVENLLVIYNYPQLGAPIK